MKNIHLLPTEKPSILYAKDGNYKLANSTMAMDWYISSAGYKPHHIYITSDEEINDEDYCVHTNQNSIIKIGKGEAKLMKGHLYLKKIILTTDQDLIADGVQAIDDNLLEWFLKNPSCEFVQSSDSSKDGFYNSLFIPKEEPKQETLEEAAEKYARKQCDDMYNNEGLTGASWGWETSLDFIAGAKWQSERMYSEEEVKQLLSFIRELRDNWDCDPDAHRYNTQCRCCEAAQILEQFKKK